MKNELMTKATRMFHRTGLKLKKHSPEILLAAGIVTGVATVVTACKATGKVNDILEDAKEHIEGVKAVMNDPEKAEKYTEEDKNKAIAVVYAQTGWELAKTYGPSIALGAASITCILASHGLMKKRNVALTAALNTTMSQFKNYRKNVVERFGENLDRELRFGLKETEIEEKVTNEDGTESTVTRTVTTATFDPNQYSEFARIFDEYCKGFTKSAEYNFMFVKSVQNWANDRLKAVGHLFLNEVYEELGFPKTQSGQIVGWIYDEKNPVGDNFVDFGLFDIHNPNARDFVNGYERAIILDFNVDGPILEYI